MQTTFGQESGAGGEAPKRARSRSAASKPRRTGKQPGSIALPEEPAAKSRGVSGPGGDRSLIEALANSKVFHDYERNYGHTLFGAGYARLTAVINEVLAEHCTRLGLSMITSYGFRTSLGAHLVEAGCDLRHVQLLLGFRNLGSTQVYLRRCKESLKAVVDAAHPRATWVAKP